MKKTRLLFTLLLVAGFATLGFGQGIDGSAHDFEGTGWGGGEICMACHTPHNAIIDDPLWNHTVSTQTFTLYGDGGSSSTLDATLAQPSGTSLLCLSCHDGSVALDSYGGATGTNFITGVALFGTDLSNDHPISFVYNTALSTADGGLHDPVTVNSSLGNPIEEDLLFGATNAATVECASCHDVHNSAGLPNLLRITNVGSELCLNCHNK